MESENILHNLVRIGTVSAVDYAGRKARVLFKDRGITSGWLYVLQHNGAGVHIEDNGNHTHTVSGVGLTSTDGEHNHNANLTYWMPAVNDTVLVLYLPVFNGDGFILGAI